MGFLYYIEISYNIKHTNMDDKERIEMLSDLNRVKRLATMRIELDTAMEYLKWANLIPELSFDSSWKVRIIPPFGGAIVRFTVSKGNRYVSVYLDCYGILGCEDTPYWEINAYNDCDCSRFDMNDVESLMQALHDILD